MLTHHPWLCHPDNESGPGSLARLQVSARYAAVVLRFNTEGPRQHERRWSTIRSRTGWGVRMLEWMTAPGKRRVLVVDDNTDNRKIIAYRLSRMGYRLIDEAANGLEALEAIAKHCPDLVIMDVMMPVMDGLEAMRAIRTLNGRAAQVPIIALTAACLPGDRERCLQAGADDYLAKPVVDPNLLRVKVTAWAGRRHRTRGGEVSAGTRADLPFVDTGAPS